MVEREVRVACDAFLKGVDRGLLGGTLHNTEAYDGFPNCFVACGSEDNVEGFLYREQSDWVTNVQKHVVVVIL